MNQNGSRQVATETVVLDAPQEASLAGSDSVFASLCNKINLKTLAEARPLEAFRDNDTLSEASAGERVGLSLVSQMPKVKS